MDVAWPSAATEGRLTTGVVDNASRSAIGSTIMRRRTMRVRTTEIRIARQTTPLGPGRAHEKQPELFFTLCCGNCRQLADRKSLNLASSNALHLEDSSAHQPVVLYPQDVVNQWRGTRSQPREQFLRVKFRILLA